MRAAQPPRAVAQQAHTACASKCWASTHLHAKSVRAAAAYSNPYITSDSHTRPEPTQQQVAGPAQQPWHAQHNVGQYPTEFWGLHASQTPQAQLLIVPGNPGYAGFYRGFMQQLHDSFKGTADVLAVSHVGHDADNLSKGTVWSLECQVQHKVQLLQQLMSPGKPPLVILAHSIGSYIMLQALQQLNSSATGSSGANLSNIAKVFLLMPFLTTDWSSWEQRVLAGAARQHGPRLAAAAGWFQHSPSWVQDRVVQAMMPGAETHAADSLRTALNEQGCLNNWHMAAQEFSTLDAPVHWGLIQHLGRKAAVVYNPADPWFQEYNTMHQVMPGLEAYAMEGLGHAFCVSTAECKVVAQLVHASVTQGAAVPADRIVAGRAGLGLRDALEPSSA